jgi:O-succinylbenzoate synthase
MNKENKIYKIDMAELFIVKLPLVSSFVSGIKEIKEKNALILKLSSEGLNGWGECVAELDPYYNYETIDTALYITKEFLLPVLFSKKKISFTGIADIFSKIRGHNTAKAMIENALSDLFCKMSGVPLYKLIGGKNSKKILSGISLGIETDINNLIDNISESINLKYHKIKLKIKKDNDINILKTVRKEFSDIPLAVDANGAYSLKDINILKELDNFNLMMIEQPLSYNDLFEHSVLQKELKTHICLDESINNLNSVKNAVKIKSCKIINIKQGRVGGILSAKNIHNYSTENNMKILSGGMLETGIGRTFNLHLQSLSGFTLPGDTSPTSRYFNEDIIANQIIIDNNGFIPIPEDIGIKINIKSLNKYKYYYEKFINR